MKKAVQIKTNEPEERVYNLLLLPAEDKISFGHLVLFLVLLPFDRIFSELVLISFLVHTIIHLNKYRARRILTRQTLILSSIFILNALCLAWSPDKKQGLDYLLRQLAIIIFPVSLSATGLDIKKIRKPLLQLFGFTCVVTLIYLYADAIRVILYYKMPVKTLLSRLFINHNFSSPIGLHATYLSLFVALAAACFLNFLITEREKKKQVIYVISLLILFAGLIQLSSRAVLVSFLLVTVFVFPFFIQKRNTRIYFISAMLLCSLITLAGLSRVDSFKKRYVSDLKNDLTQKSINNEAIESRLARWKEALPLLKQSPVVGHGTGSEKNLLQKVYFESRLYNSYLNELNTHNQYLKFLIESGLLGLLLFLFTIFWGIRAALQNRDVVFMSFLLTVAVVCFSENVLDVNKGIFFYAFFFSFLIKSGKPGSGKKRLVI